VAARIAGQAKAEQILTTGDTRVHLGDAFRRDMRLVISTKVKGRRQPLDIHELTWGDAVS
jgi:class 3 adenylate cyclase